MPVLEMFFSNLSTSDCIQLIGIISSFSLSLVAIIISVCTMRQSTKVFEESTRPIIHIYPVYVDFVLYIVIKNAGSSVAYIDEITCNHKFTEEETLNKKLGENIFSHLQQAMLTPGYSIKCPIFEDRVGDDFLSFYVRYHSTLKTYEDSFCFQPFLNEPFAMTQPSKSENPADNLHEIAKQLSDIVKNGL